MPVTGCAVFFIGFETLNREDLEEQSKYHNLVGSARQDPYEKAVKKLNSSGVMVNASFVFGMDHDYETVFERTVDWAVR